MDRIERYGITLEERHAERAANMRGGDEAFRRLALAVIFEAAKNYVPPNPKNKDRGLNSGVRKFFLGDDYIMWAAIAGINIDGREFYSKLVKQGGVNKLLKKNSLEEVV